MLRAHEAVGVLLDREVLKLVLVAVAGWWMIETGDAMTAFVAVPGVLNVLYEGIGALTTLVGYVLYYAGVLSLLVKVVYEAVLLAENR